MSDDLLYLLHIRECIERIATYTQAGQDEFMQSTLIQDAVARNFEIIGEAAKGISPELKQANAGAPWRRIAGFRDVLIHNYLGVDLDQVWVVVRDNLPELRNQVQAMLDALSQATEPRGE